MSKHICAFLLAAGIVTATAASAGAQSPAPVQSGKDDGWKVAIYPVYVWVPFGIDINVDLPPTDGGGSGSIGNEIIDGRFDGAFFAGFSASHGPWRIDANGMWAAVGGDRPDRPTLTVDAKIFYSDMSVGGRIYKDLYIMGGVRHFAVKYDIKLQDYPNFSRKPGVWDPLVGLGWHYERTKAEVHATFEGGGFGVGTDVDLSGSFRADWKPVKHFGLTGGYSFLYFKLSDTLASRTFTVRQTLHGPIAGIGLYF